MNNIVIIMLFFDGVFLAALTKEIIYSTAVSIKILNNSIHLFIIFYI